MHTTGNSVFFKKRQKQEKRNFNPSLLAKMNFVASNARVCCEGGVLTDSLSSQLTPSPAKITLRTAPSSTNKSEYTSSNSTRGKERIEQRRTIFTYVCWNVHTLAMRAGLNESHMRLSGIRFHGPKIFAKEVIKKSSPDVKPGARVENLHRTSAPAAAKRY